MAEFYFHLFKSVIFKVKNIILFEHTVLTAAHTKWGSVFTSCEL
jgi:hypothetical protein